MVLGLKQHISNQRTHTNKVCLSTAESNHMWTRGERLCIDPSARRYTRFIFNNSVRHRKYYDICEATATEKDKNHREAQPPFKTR